MKKLTFIIISFLFTSQLYAQSAPAQSIADQLNATLKNSFSKDVVRSYLPEDLSTLDPHMKKIFDDLPDSITLNDTTLPEILALYLISESANKAIKEVISLGGGAVLFKNVTENFQAVTIDTDYGLTGITPKLGLNESFNTASSQKATRSAIDGIIRKSLFHRYSGGDFGTYDNFILQFTKDTNMLGVNLYGFFPGSDFQHDKRSLGGNAIENFRPSAWKDALAVQRYLLPSHIRRLQRFWQDDTTSAMGKFVAGLTPQRLNFTPQPRPTFTESETYTIDDALSYIATPPQNGNAHKIQAAFNIVSPKITTPDSSETDLKNRLYLAATQNFWQKAPDFSKKTGPWNGNQERDNFINLPLYYFTAFDSADEKTQAAFLDAFWSYLTFHAAALAEEVKHKNASLGDDHCEGNTYCTYATGMANFSYKKLIEHLIGEGAFLDGLTTVGVDPESKLVTLFKDEATFKAVLNTLIRRLVFREKAGFKILSAQILATLFPFENLFLKMMATDLLDDSDKPYLAFKMAKDDFYNKLGKFESLAVTFSVGEDASGDAAPLMALLDLMIENIDDNDDEPLDIPYLGKNFKLSLLKSMKDYIAERMGQLIFAEEDGIDFISAAENTPSGFKIVDKDKAAARTKLFLREVLKTRFAVDPDLMGDKAKESIVADFDAALPRLEQTIKDWFGYQDELLTDDDRKALKKTVMGEWGLTAPKDPADTSGATQTTTTLDFSDINIKTEFSTSAKLKEVFLSRNYAAVTENQVQEDTAINNFIEQNLESLSNQQMSGEIKGLGTGLTPVVDMLKKNFPDYSYGWLITSVIKQDEEAAAKRCADKFEGNPKLKAMLDRPRDYYAVVMRTRTDKAFKSGETDPLMVRKKHYCGVILSRGKE